MPPGFTVERGCDCGLHHHGDRGSKYLSSRRYLHRSADGVTISDATAGAVIYYTTDGSTPTNASAVYSAPLIVSTNQNSSRRLRNSPATRRKRTVCRHVHHHSAGCDAWIHASQRGTYAIRARTSRSATRLRARPSTSRPMALRPRHLRRCIREQFAVSGSETLKAIAIATGFSSSVVGSAGYTITTAAATPTFSPVGGTYVTAQSVIISDTTSGAKIYYTTNGTTPTTSVDALLNAGCGECQPDAQCDCRSDWICEQRGRHGGVHHHAASGYPRLLSGGRQLHHGADGDHQRCNAVSGDLLHHRRLDSDLLIDAFTAGLFWWPRRRR